MEGDRSHSLFLLLQSAQAQVGEMGRTAKGYGLRERGSEGGSEGEGRGAGEEGVKGRVREEERREGGAKYVVVHGCQPRDGHDIPA